MENSYTRKETIP
jgi:exonuclease III